MKILICCSVMCQKNAVIILLFINIQLILTLAVLSKNEQTLTVPNQLSTEQKSSALEAMNYLAATQGKLVANKRIKNEIRKKKMSSGKESQLPKVWDHWSKWTSCSVTCGIGKITRWRHCVEGGCASGEKEAQIKTCTLPAC